MSKKNTKAGTVAENSPLRRPSRTGDVVRPASDSGAPTGSGGTTGPTKKTYTVSLDIELLDRVRNAAYWGRRSVADIIGAGLKSELARMEEENGGPFPARPVELQSGRRAQ